MTHRSKETGDLVWLATPVFDEEPIFFSLSAAGRQKAVTPIAAIPIPSALKDFPVMRSGAKNLGLSMMWHSKKCWLSGGAPRKCGSCNTAMLFTGDRKPGLASATKSFPVSSIFGA
jgi:hypothetical protein